MKKVFFSLAVLCAVSCRPSPETKYDMLRFPSPVAVADEEVVVHQNTVTSKSVPQTAPLQDTSRKIIKEGDIRFESGDVKATRTQVISATRRLGGYLAGESESGYEDGVKTYNLSLRVPAPKFEELLDAISANAGRIDSKNIRVNDITANYIDTRSRLANKRRLEQRYLELLAKATKIADMITIENKLAGIREEIESVEGQFRMMQKQVAFSTLDVAFYSKDVAVETGKGFWYRIGGAFRQGGESLGGIFLALVGSWPLLLGLALTLFVLRWRWKKWRRAD